MSKLGNIIIRKNSGANTGIRRRLNFIEGANVTLTIADDGPGDEIDITIASAAGVGADQDIFYPAPNPDDYKGYFASMRLADDLETIVRQTFYLPTNWSGSWSVDVVVIPDATGDLRWGVDTNFGEVCAGEYDDHTDTVAVGQTAVQVDDIECLDITGALTGAVALDLVGCTFLRDGDNVLDTVNDKVHYMGILLRAPGE